MIYDSTQAIADIPGATYTALRARFRKLADVVDVLMAERKAVLDEMRRREVDAKAQLRLGALSEADKAVYRKVLG